RRVGVEPQADLTTALLGERRQPVREWIQGSPSGQPPRPPPDSPPAEPPPAEAPPPPPFTFFFRPEPAEKRGTLPPGMKMRSPVRGLPPCRGPRSATPNLPNPVKFTSPPPWRTSVIASSTASTAWPASFLLPILLSRASTSRNSALVTVVSSYGLDSGPA